MPQFKETTKNDFVSILMNITSKIIPRLQYLDEKWSWCLQFFKQIHAFSRIKKHLADLSW